MRIAVTKPFVFDGHVRRRGQELRVSASLGRFLVAQGYAQAVEAETDDSEEAPNADQQAQADTDRGSKKRQKG